MTSERPTLTNILWTAGNPLYQRILAHPFMIDLAQSKLTRSQFSFYLVQDFLFLKEASRALQVTSSNNQYDDWIQTFNECSTDVIMLERSLHETFFAELAISRASLEAESMAPTNEGYSSYLLLTSYEYSFPEAFSSLLPCFWLYRNLGQDLLKCPITDPMYQKWAEFYGGADYDEMISDVLDLVDEVGEALSEKETETVVKRFVHSCRYEWLFWEMAYREEKWPG